MRGEKKKWGDGVGDGARVSIFFTMNTIFLFCFFRVGGGGTVRYFFLQRIQT